MELSGIEGTGVAKISASVNAMSSGTRRPACSAASMAPMAGEIVGSKNKRPVLASGAVILHGWNPALSPASSALADHTSSPRPVRKRMPGIAVASIDRRQGWYFCLDMRDRRRPIVDQMLGAISPTSTSSAPTKCAARWGKVAVEQEVGVSGTSPSS